jgi:hypothetical protein
VKHKEFVEALKNVPLESTWGMDAVIWMRSVDTVE